MSQKTKIYSSVCLTSLVMTTSVCTVVPRSDVNFWVFLSVSWYLPTHHHLCPTMAFNMLCICFLRNFLPFISQQFIHVLIYQFYSKIKLYFIYNFNKTEIFKTWWHHFPSPFNTLLILSFDYIIQSIHIYSAVH